MDRIRLTAARQEIQGWLLTILKHEAPVGDIRDGVNDAAGWLVANGHSEYSVEETSVLLATLLAEAIDRRAFDGIPR